MKKFIFLLGSLSIVLTLFLIACATPPPTSSVDGDTEPVPIKMVLLPFLGLSPYFIAAEEGYFAAEGLDVEFFDMNSGIETIPALVQGELDVAQSTINFSMLNAIYRGGKIKMVGSGPYFAADNCPDSGLLANKTLIASGELDSPEGWQDRRFASSPTGAEGYYLDVLLNEYDLSIDDVEIEDLPPPVLPEALQSGSIDFAHSSEPWVTRIKETADAEFWVTAKDILPDFQFAVLLFGPSILEENPEAGERFMRGFLNAVRQYNEGKTDRNVEIIAKYTDMDVDLLREICWPSIPADGQVNVPSIIQFQEWGLKRGLLDGMVPEEDFWDGSFIESAD